MMIWLNPIIKSHESCYQHNKCGSGKMEIRDNSINKNSVISRIDKEAWTKCYSIRIYWNNQEKIRILTRLWDSISPCTTSIRKIISYIFTYKLVELRKWFDATCWCSTYSYERMIMLFVMINRFKERVWDSYRLCMEFVVTNILTDYWCKGSNSYMESNFTSFDSLFRKFIP